MKKHTKVYIEYFQKQGLDPHEFICEVCGKGGGSSLNLDIHHILARKSGGSKREETIENLMALCRRCHTEYGDITDLIPKLQEIHLNYMQTLKPNRI